MMNLSMPVPAGLALVVHALLSLLAHVHQWRMTVTQMVEKTARNQALNFSSQILFTWVDGTRVCDGHQLGSVPTAMAPNFTHWIS
ncbi:hypothetical protein [Neptunomonas sp.]|uniref:hypothetical protein n=1 Tax=Neptunomonas sp. TaxID=1971898 RepID=UPI0035679D7F